MRNKLNYALVSIYRNARTAILKGISDLGYRHLPWPPTVGQRTVSASG